MKRTVGGEHRFVAPGVSLIVVLASLVACGVDSQPSESAEDREAPPPPTESIRVISLVPSFTEIVYALGAEEMLVGVTPYCKFPPEAQKKPKVGGLVTVNYEKLIELAPDLVLMVPGHDEKKAKLQRLGIDSLTMATETIDDIFAGIARIGRALGRDDAAARLAEELESGLDGLRAKYAPRPDAAGGRKPVRVLFIAGRNPGTLQRINACGSDNFINELLALIGVENVLGRTASPWPIVGIEAIVKLDPDVILDQSIRQGDAPVDRDAHMRAWDSMPSIRAVREGRVLAVSDEHITIPGPGVVESALQLAELIHSSVGRP